MNPRRLKEMTEEDVHRTVCYLSKKPLKKLRKWQDIVSRQIESARNEAALENLQEMERRLAAADQAREFPA